MACISRYNIARSIYLATEINDLCGFTQEEVEKAVRSAATARGFENPTIRQAVDMMRTWYNGYKFAVDAEKLVYNPTMALYFIESFYAAGAYPRKMVDSNLSMDAAKLEFISRIPSGGQILLNMMRKDRKATVAELADRFGIREIAADRSKENAFIVSFLYFLGILTLSGLTSTGKLALFTSESIDS